MPLVFYVVVEHVLEHVVVELADDTSQQAVVDVNIRRQLDSWFCRPAFGDDFLKKQRLGIGTTARKHAVASACDGLMVIDALTARTGFVPRFAFQLALRLAFRLSGR